MQFAAGSERFGLSFLRADSVVRVFDAMRR